MLDWSNTQYKFTFGIGSLATAGIISELWKPFLPKWVVMVIALLPLVVFVFVHPHEMPAKFVRAAHVFASVWYVTTVISLSVGLYLTPVLPRGWFILPLFCTVGLIPSVLVLSQAIQGRYRLPSEHDDADGTD
jgi:hypothetical protein